MKKWLLDPKMYIEFGIATLLYVANIVLTLLFPYFTEHKAYYDSTAYIVVLTGAYLLYAITVHISRKKSASDIAVLTYAFFALWEVSYKTGLVKNDLLIPSPVLGVSAGYCARHHARTSGRLDPEDQGGAASFVQCDHTDPAAYVFRLSDHDIFHLPSGSHCGYLFCSILADLPGNGSESGTDRQIHY